MSTPTLREAAQAPTPCPFCKSAKIGVHQHKQRRAVGYKAMCLGCGISQTGMAYGSPEQAIAAWNTRAALTQAADAGAAEPVGTVRSGRYASGMPWCEVEWHVQPEPPSGTTLYTAQQPQPPAALTQAADAGAAEPVAWRLQRKNHLTGEWVSDENERWANGAPPPDLVENVAQYPDLYRLCFAYTAPPAQQLQQAVAREREKWTAIADRLLAHCGEGECPTCSEIICPHGDTMHFHHDGCPTCEQEAAAIRQQGTP